MSKQSLSFIAMKVNRDPVRGNVRSTTGNISEQGHLQTGKRFHSV